jgi:hypothetical protein
MLINEVHMCIFRNRYARREIGDLALIFQAFCSATRVSCPEFSTSRNCSVSSQVHGTAFAIPFAACSKILLHELVA